MLMLMLIMVLGAIDIAQQGRVAREKFCLVDVVKMDCAVHDVVRHITF